MNTAHIAVAEVKKLNPLIVAAFWCYVSIPLIWGVWQTAKKAAALF